VMEGIGRDHAGNNQKASHVGTRGGGGENNRPGLYLAAQDFPAWLDEQLLAKYALDYDRLLGDLRPLLLLFTELRRSLEELSSLFASHLLQKTGNHGNSGSGNNGASEGRAVPYIEAMACILSSLPALPSLAMDSTTLASMNTQMREAVQLMLVNLQTLSHVDIEHRSLRRKFLRQTKALNDHLGKLAYEVEQISRIEEKHAIFLLKIDSIKDATSWELERLVASHLTVQEARLATKTCLQECMDRYTAAKRKYETLLSHKDLEQAHLLEQKSKEAVWRINQATRSFVQMATALRAKCI